MSPARPRNEGRAVRKGGSRGVLDPQERRIRVLVLEGDKYTEHAHLVGEGAAASKRLGGFSVDVAEALAAGKNK